MTTNIEDNMIADWTCNCGNPIVAEWDKANRKAKFYEPIADVYFDAEWLNDAQSTTTGECAGDNAPNLTDHSGVVAAGAGLSGADTRAWWNLDLAIMVACHYDPCDECCDRRNAAPGGGSNETYAVTYDLDCHEAGACNANWNGSIADITGLRWWFDCQWVYETAAHGECVGDAEDWGAGTYDILLHASGCTAGTSNQCVRLIFCGDSGEKNTVIDITANTDVIIVTPNNCPDSGIGTQQQAQAKQENIDNPGTCDLPLGLITVTWDRE